MKFKVCKGISKRQHLTKSSEGLTPLPRTIELPPLQTLYKVLCISLFSMFFALGVLGCTWLIIKHTQFNTLEVIENVLNTDHVSRIGCDSDSMGLTLNCGDKVYSREVKNDESLLKGHIYIYEKGNQSIVHRLVACIDQDCNQTVFKGDNNQVAEFVNRSQIKKKVLQVEYK